MKLIRNDGRRRLGIPGRPAIILNPGQIEKLEEHQFVEIQKNRTVVRWLETGVITIVDGDGKDMERSQFKPNPKAPGQRPARFPRQKHDVREVVELPEGLKGEGREINHVGGGWYEVWINGFKVTDTNVRKDEAKMIASEYLVE